MNSIVTNEDCMVVMARYPDKYFDLAVVDPPYGGGQHFNFRFGTGDAVYKNNAPTKEYFDELFRISKNQIIWGGNYFTYALPVNRCWISWYKGQPIDSFSDFELAWTSFDKTSRQINLESYGFRHADKRAGEKTIHPTQKPVALYDKVLADYAEKGQRIFDSHLGSGSSRISAYKAGLDFTGCELDKDYFEAQEARFKIFLSQQDLFVPKEEQQKVTQESLAI